MADLTKKSPVRDISKTPFPLNKMHTSTTDFFRLDVQHFMETTGNDSIAFDIHSFIESAPNPYSIDGTVTFGLFAFYVPKRIVWDKFLNYKSDLEGSLKPPYFTLGDLVDAFYSDANPWKDNPSYFNSALKVISNIDKGSSYIPFVQNYTSSADLPAFYRNYELSAEPLRALNRIWWDYFRDKQRISDASEGSFCFKSGGHISMAELIILLTPKYRCHSKNYFTTAFEAPSSAPDQVVAGRLATGLNSGLIIDGAGENALGVSNSPDKVYASVLQDPGVAPRSDANDIISVSTVNDQRKANSWQQYFERMLFAGKSRISRLFAVGGTAPTIEELQMSDYIGGHEEELMFDSQTSPTSSKSTDENPRVGGAGAFGYNPANAQIAGQKFQTMKTLSGDGFNLKTLQYQTDEEGYIFVISSVCPVLQYYQGLGKAWTRGLSSFEKSYQLNYPTPDFENQPLQPVLNSEVLFNPNIDPMGVYGFQQMYMDWKVCTDSLGGDYVLNESVDAFDKLHFGRDIEKYLLILAEDDPTLMQEYLTPAVLTQTSGVDQAIFDEKFTLSYPSLDHFRINNKIECTAYRPLMPDSLPSLSASESRQTKVNFQETGGIRL